MVKTSTLTKVSIGICTLSTVLLVGAAVLFGLFAAHTTSDSLFDELNDQHLTDDEKDALLDDDDREVSLIVAATAGAPIVIKSDVVFNEQVILQNNLTVVETVLRRLITRRLVTRTFEGAPGDLVDITELITIIEERLNPNPDALAMFTATLISEMMRYQNIQDTVNATCTDYSELILLEQTQQSNLTDQNVRIADLEGLVSNGTAVNGTVFETYNVNTLIDIYNALFTNVTMLETSVDNLIDEAVMLEDSINMFLNMSGNGTRVLGVIVNETLILTGQIGTLFNDTSALVTACQNSSAQATNLLSLVTTQLTLVNVTQLTVINSTLTQIGLDITAIYDFLNQIEILTGSHTTYINELQLLNVTVVSAKNNITALLDQTEVFLDAANNTIVTTDNALVQTNITLQTFVTTVETFLNNSGIALLSNVSAANTTLYQEYDLLITNFTTLEGLVLVLESNLTDLWTRVGIAENNVTVLAPLIIALDSDISTLLSDAAALELLTTTLEIDAGVLNDTTTTLLTNVLALNSTFVTLQSDTDVLNATAFAQQTTIDDHESRITVLEDIVASIGTIDDPVYYEQILPTLTAGESLVSGNVVSIDETGRVVLASGLREVDEFVYAQQFNSTLLGDTLTVGASDDIHAGAATAIDAYDNMYLTINYEGNAVTFENNTLTNQVPSIITDNRDRIYSGVGDVLLAKYNYAQQFVWKVVVDSALSATISGISVSPVTQDIWVSGSVLATGGSTDFGLTTTSRTVLFYNADAQVAFNYTLGVGATDVLDNVALGFLGRVSQLGEWTEIQLFEADGYSGNGTDFAVVNDVTINRRGDVYACGFYNRDVSAQTVSWLWANFTSGGTVLLGQFARSRADLAVVSRTAAPYLHAVSRGSGFYLRYTPVTPADALGTVVWSRTDEGVDDLTAPGAQQRPVRFTRIVLDQADNVFLMGWYGFDIRSVDVGNFNGEVANSFTVNFTLDASDTGNVVMQQNRNDEDDMQLILARIDKKDGDYMWMTTDISASVGESGVFSQNHRYSGGVAPTNTTKEIYNFYDMSYQSTPLLNHRGDIVLLTRVLCNNNLVSLLLRYVMSSGETGISNITCTDPRTYLIKFSGSSGEYIQHVRDEVGDPINIARAVIGPDSYIWLAYRTTNNANLGGSGLLTPAPGALSVDYFYKLDPDFTVVWGEARSSEISFVQEVGAVLVDRHRNFWYIEDVFSGAQTVNVTQYPDFEPSSLSFRLVRNVDMTHIPIGVTIDTVVENDPVRVVMEGRVINTTMPTVAGRNYCNFYGTVQTSKCYSMPSMGYAPATGSLTVDIHRDALRFPTRSNSVY